MAEGTVVLAIHDEEELSVIRVVDHITLHVVEDISASFSLCLIKVDVVIKRESFDLLKRICLIAADGKVLELAHQHTSPSLLLFGQLHVLAVKLDQPDDLLSLSEEGKSQHHVHRLRSTVES